MWIPIKHYTKRLKVYLFPKKLFSPAPILVILLANYVNLLGTRTKEFMEILFLQEMCRILHSDPCLSEQAYLFLRSREAMVGQTSP